MKHVKLIALLLVLIAVLAVSGCCCICGCPSTGYKYPVYTKPVKHCPNRMIIDLSKNNTCYGPVAVVAERG